MFFQPSVDKRTFPILEVGPGALPFELSDVWLDMKFGDEDQVAQSGHSRPAKGKPLVYYDGGRFPFRDKAFEYVIASHVLEHVPWDRVPLFISELERVASAGYIELPRWEYEMINDVNEHLLTGDVRDGRLHLYRKGERHDYGFFTKALLERSREYRQYVAAEKELYFCRIEWEGKVLFERHETGYPVTDGPEAIVAALNEDFARLDLSPVTPQQVIAQECRKFWRRGLACLKRRIGQHLPVTASSLTVGRQAIGFGKIADMMMCPVCGGSIGGDYRCEQCEFHFRREGLEYISHYPPL
ncbi:class I SAM-dependent methyltransferase [Candidatus Uhrbacteria bacterium]|nr:class I SAM-dependent methyltransferase [Candidatus Uhrbacteria bacterium]